MTIRIHTKIATTIAAAAVIAAAVAPCAAPAGPTNSAQVHIPPSLVNFREPGSTGYLPTSTQVRIPSRLADFREPGSTGYVPTTKQFVIPSRLTHIREPGSTGWVPKATHVTVTTPGAGFDWDSALIGAGAALGIALTSAGALMMVRKRRTLAHKVGGLVMGGGQ